MKFFSCDKIDVTVLCLLIPKKVLFSDFRNYFWKENDFYKQGFLKNVYNKNQRKKTKYFDELRTDIHTYIHTYIQTDRQTDIQTYRHTAIQPASQPDSQTDRQTDRHIYI